MSDDTTPRSTGDDREKPRPRSTGDGADDARRGATDGGPEVAPPRAARGEPPRYFDSPEVGPVLSMVVALAGEMAVMRDRLDTVERLLASGTPVTRDAIDGYLPDERVRAERDAWRQEFLSMVFRVLREEGERLARDAARPYADVVGDAEAP